MAKKKVASLVYQLRRLGITADQYVVVPEGVFFATHKPARLYAKKHNKDLTHIDEQVSGWLARNRPDSN